MNIGVDAAALGMSGAVSATTNDVNSGYWNPAGLVHVEDHALALMHSSYFANIANYNYVGFAMPLDDSTTSPHARRRKKAATSQIRSRRATSASEIK